MSMYPFSCVLVMLVDNVCSMMNHYILVLIYVYARIFVVCVIYIDDSELFF